jgi:hypothetical protein
MDSKPLTRRRPPPRQPERNRQCEPDPDAHADIVHRHPDGDSDRDSHANGQGLALHPPTLPRQTRPATRPHGEPGTRRGKTNPPRACSGESQTFRRNSGTTRRVVEGCGRRRGSLPSRLRGTEGVPEEQRPGVGLSNLETKLPMPPEERRVRPQRHARRPTAMPHNLGLPDIRHCRIGFPCKRSSKPKAISAPPRTRR